MPSGGDTTRGLSRCEGSAGPTWGRSVDDRRGAPPQAERRRMNAMIMPGMLAVPARPRQSSAGTAQPGPTAPPRVAWNGLATVGLFLDLTPYGRQETWEDSPEGWPQSAPYRWWRLHDEYGA